MLRGQDSNLQPIDYTYLTVSNKGGLYHPRCGGVRRFLLEIIDLLKKYSIKDSL